MHEATSVLWLGSRVVEECNHIILVGDLSYGHACFLVDGCGLRFCYRIKSFYLSAVEARRLSKVLQSHLFWNNSVKLG